MSSNFNWPLHFSTFLFGGLLQTYVKIDFFLFMDMEKKKMELKSPETSTPKVPPAHARAALGSMPVPPKRPKIGES